MESRNESCFFIAAVFPETLAFAYRADFLETGVVQVRRV